MLSRVAERTFWIGRYLERAENLARLCQVFGKLFLDLPSSTGLGWLEIIRIVGAGGQFQSQGDRADSGAAIGFLLADPANPGSLLSSLAMARENARTTRDILPSEAWLTINRLYLDARAQAPSITTAAGRNRALAGIVGECQKFSGLIAGTMSHGDAYRFVQAGVNLERADMTSRMLDAAIALLLSNREELEAYDNTLWMAVLRSVSGYQMYRQSVRRRVTGKDVVRFLFADPEFPRSVEFCIDRVGEIVARLPRNSPVVKAVEALSVQLGQRDFDRMSRAQLHEFIDRLQRDVGRVHDAITANWFQPDNPA